MPKVSFLRKTSLCLASVLTVSTLAAPSPVFAKGCAESAIAPHTVPSILWGELQSVSVAQDATNFTGNQRADARYPLATSIDIENGYVFLSAYFGFQIWDIQTNPEAPIKLGVADGWNGAFASWIPGNSEVDKVVFTIDAPSGDDKLAVVGGVNPVGLSIWNTLTKSQPSLLYQDAPSKQIHQVYAATIGGRAYAFGAVFQGDQGIFVYDMTAAKQYSRCLEDRTTAPSATTCSGVYKGRIFSGSSVYVHGMPFGQRHFLVRSSGDYPPFGVNILDVTTPTNPVPVVGGFTGTFSAGVALWSQANKAYLAVRTANKVHILDVTTCLTTGCSSLPTPIAIVPVAPVAESDKWKSVDFSRSGTTPMLFIGNLDECHVGETLAHTEYVLDMSNPAAPRDITPSGTIVDLGETVNYWSWYYSDFIRGFSSTAPRGGKFNGTYLYRADLSLFDVHKWTGNVATPPVASFTWTPGEIYAGDPVSFTDTSQGTVTTRTWTFQDGTPTASVVHPGASVAGAGATLHLAGLRQDAETQSTVWIFNSSSQKPARYDVLYLSRDGQEIGRIENVLLPAGKTHQITPAQHRLPATGAADGFSVQILVTDGMIFSSAQVVKTATRETAAIQGVTH